MNLFDCQIPYTALPESILDLESKLPLLMALDIYRQRSLLSLEMGEDISPYERRKRSETARELLRRGVILEGKDGKPSLVPLDMAKDRSLAKTRLVIPSQFEYGSLSLASVKLLMAVYSLVRYSRTPFRIIKTQAELAEKARLTEKSVRAALKGLVDYRLITTKKLWQQATQVTLLDPESGVELYYIARFHRDRMDRIPVWDRYYALLTDHDPHDRIRHERGPVAKGTVRCPFCGGGKGKNRNRSFGYEADQMQGIDRWRCFRCKRHGDSARLWAKLAPWIGKISWRNALEETMGGGKSGGHGDDVADEEARDYEEWAAEEEKKNDGS